MSKNFKTINLLVKIEPQPTSFKAFLIKTGGSITNSVTCSWNLQDCCGAKSVDIYQNEVTSEFILHVKLRSHKVKNK